ncbi:SanA protein [Kushneria sinocarnis]|uniref:SanA protein n=1 Tax=Kushneria sinocarnis TaxID=595502 RepID=A0A420WTE9_9GAMM|nr:ElyC/SanA/YdcF family protein [Kushneria sinocarnis]RKQ96315.1 SanA protein [Kushneria sinocarnis]
MSGVIRKGAAVLAALLLAGTLVLALANGWIWWWTHERIRPDPAACDAAPVGLVFGTSWGLRGGGVNPWYQARLDTAARLYHLGLVDHLLLSGDNHTRYYNEPVVMWRDMKKRGVPPGAMTLDYAGFSTFDSLVRARRVFGAHRVMLISQPWHLPRALYIADHVGLEATGCTARTAAPSYHWSLRLREWLARVWTLGDLFLWQRQPHFLGPRIRMQPGQEASGDEEKAERLPKLPLCRVLSDVSDDGSDGDRAAESSAGSCATAAP